MPFRAANRDTPIEIEGEIRASTDKAVLFDDGDVRVWLPKSETAIAWKDGDALLTSDIRPCTVTIPEWLAYEKGLI